MLPFLLLRYNKLRKKKDGDLKLMFFLSSDDNSNLFIGRENDSTSTLGTKYGYNLCN